MVEILKSKTQSIQIQSDIVLVRQLVRASTIEIGFGIVDQTKIVTAASELARNTLEYGKGGTVEIQVITESNQKKGVRLVFEDQGPGISNIELALTDGYTTGGGLGMGLSGSKRLMSDLVISSQVGKGTRIITTKWK